jgi:hypothetical protein
LTDRKQLVSLYGKKSTLLSLDIGVILGSVIGPLLFSKYINDITKIGLNCKTILYARNTTFIFSHKNLAELEKIVNENIIILTEWLLENKLVVNYKKSHFMIIGSKNSCNFKVSINNNSIIKTWEIKILGVIFDDLLKFDSHINAPPTYLRNSVFYKRIELRNQLSRNLRLINCFKIFKRELCNLFI